MEGVSSCGMSSSYCLIPIQNLNSKLGKAPKKTRKMVSHNACFISNDLTKGC